MLKGLYEVIKKLENYILAVLGVVLFFVVTTGVIYRYVFQMQLTWSYELSILLYIWVTFIGASIAIREGGHVEITILIDVLPKKIRNAVLLIKNVLLMVIFILGVYYGIEIVGRTSRQMFETIPISRAWTYSALPVGMTLLALHLLVLIIKDYQTIKKNGTIVEP